MVPRVLEAAFELPQGGLNKEREVLRNFGNMSAPTVLFVLQQALEDKLRAGPCCRRWAPGSRRAF